MKPHPYAAQLNLIALGHPMQVKFRCEWRDTNDPIAAVARGDEVRIKPTTICINHIEVPSPLTSTPQLNSWVYLVDFRKIGGVATILWIGSPFQTMSLQRGLMHKNEQAARLHYEALVSFFNREEV